MAKKLYEEADIQDIAVAIREKNGTSTKYKASQMASAVRAIQTDQLPAYYADYMTTKIAQIQSLMSSAGDDGLVFIMFSDSHMELSGSGVNGGNSGKLAYKVMDECQVPLALHFGDAGSNSPQSTEALCVESLEKFNEMVKPLQGRLFQVLGNHDGAWGLPVDTDADGETDTYPYNMTREKTYGYALQKNRMGLSTVLGPDGSYFYVDDYSSHTRFLMLNTSDKPYETNSDGTMVNASNTMKGFAIRQAQVDWMISALNVPDGWSVITCSHIPLHPNFLDSSVQIRGLLAAYKDKATYSATYAGSYGWDALNISADFTGYKGEYIAHFSGHAHNDYHYKASSFGIDMVTVACDGRISNCSYMTDETYSNKALGTIYEQCLDVVIVDKSEKTINTVRIGAGANRIISYTGAVVAHTVTNNLTNCTSDNAAMSVSDGGSYTATLTPSDGYVLDIVTVTMGGTDITSTAYADGVITIGNVTGNIVISATAYADTPEAVNLWDLASRTEYTKADVTLGQSSSSEIKAADTRTIRFDKYVRGATSNGNWNFVDANRPTLTITEDGFTIDIVVAQLGLGVPMNFEVGKTYSISYTASAGCRLYATYFDESGVYATSAAIVSDESAGGTFNKTLTVADHAYCQLTFRAGIKTITFSDIVIKEVS